MSESNQTTNDHYQAFELTEKGYNLRQGAIAGGKDGRKYVVDFTRGAVGIGRPEPGTDVYGMTALVDPVLNVPVKESYAEHVNHLMTVVISNAELQEEILMTEVGIFARLADAETGAEIMPEVLYGYTYTHKYDYIPVAKNYFVYRELIFNTVLSREGKFTIVFDGGKVFLTVKDFAEYSGSLEQRIPKTYICPDKPAALKPGDTWYQVLSEAPSFGGGENVIVLGNSVVLGTEAEIAAMDLNVGDLALQIVPEA